MKSGLLLLPVLLLGISAAGHAFSLNMASDEVTEFGQGPRSVMVPGYGEIVFESGPDGVLVVDSAYASTDRIEVSVPSRESAAERSFEVDAAVPDPGVVEISNRRAHDLPAARQAAPLQSLDSALQHPPGGWNAVPEAASATLGIIGTLMLLLRRRSKTASMM